MNRFISLILLFIIQLQGYINQNLFIDVGIFPVKGTNHKLWKKIIQRQYNLTLSLPSLKIKMVFGLNLSMKYFQN